MITLKQLFVAREMAKEYGHLWGNCPSEVLHKAVDAQDVQVIHDHVLRKFWIDNGIDPDSRSEQERSLYNGALGPGICGPQLAHDWRITHLTGTRRLHWEIDEDGAVELEITRPVAENAAVVLRSKIDTGMEEDAVNVCGEFYPRHLMALADAMIAARRAQAMAERWVRTGDEDHAI